MKETFRTGQAMEPQVKLFIAMLVLIILLGIEWAVKLSNESGLSDDTKWNTNLNVHKSQD